MLETDEPITATTPTPAAVVAARWFDLLDDPSHEVIVQVAPKLAEALDALVVEQLGLGPLEVPDSDDGYGMPEPGDVVMRLYPDWSTVEGTWEVVEGGAAVLRLENGTVHTDPERRASMHVLDYSVKPHGVGIPYMRAALLGQIAEDRGDLERSQAFKDEADAMAVETFMGWRAPAELRAQRNQP